MGHGLKFTSLLPIVPTDIHHFVRFAALLNHLSMTLLVMVAGLVWSHWSLHPAA